ncbi:MAG: hypothetical protein ACI9JD_001907 [Rhodococcus sp. (in: high G+C Gram-positive bacteria)]|jgi:hypothetical protein
MPTSVVRSVEPTFHDPKPFRDLGYGRCGDVPPQALEALIRLLHGRLAPHRGDPFDAVLGRVLLCLRFVLRF